MNMSCRLLLFLLIFKYSLSFEAVDTRGGKITGGYEAKPHSNPYVVSLQSRFLWLRFRLCTGSILSERWILTAGHCVTDSWAKWLAMDAIVGAHNLAKISNSQIFPISHRIAHPKYGGGVEPYDIAMLRTSEKMHFSPKVQPISLPTSAPTFKEDEDLLITGWGALQSTLFIPELPNRLQEVEVSYLPYTECYRAVDAIKEVYDANPLIETANICTGPISGGIAGCTGDSGGPLVQYVPYSIEDSTTTSKSTSEEDATSALESTYKPTVMITGKPSTTTTDPTTSAVDTIAASTIVKTTMTPTTTAKTTTTKTTAANIFAASSIASSTTTAAAATTTAAITTEATSKPAITTETVTHIEAATTTETGTTAPARKRLWYNRSTIQTSYGTNSRRRVNNQRALKTDMIPTIVGVLSWGAVPCGEKGAPTVYSNVTNYLDFINKYLHIS